MDSEEAMIHYHANMAALLALGEWMEYLRTQGVYDNTRIIITADHGRHLNSFSDMRFGPEPVDDIMLFNPLMLVKDFGQTEFKVDEQFMTNADTPLMAFKGLIDHPRNPFTGNEITDTAKYDDVQYVHRTYFWQTSENNGNVFRPGRWYSVSGDMLDRSSWKYLGEFEIPPEAQ